MKKTKWWLRIVGAFYLLLTGLNLYGIFINPQFFRDILPFAANDLNVAIKAYVDAWFAFILELGVLGAMMLYASRDPVSSRILVLTVIWAEVFRGIVDDAFLISRGYSAAEYIPFIVLHLIIIVTGLVILRQESSKK